MTDAGRTDELAKLRLIDPCRNARLFGCRHTDRVEAFQLELSQQKSPLEFRFGTIFADRSINR